MTFSAQVDLKGNIPRTVANKGIVGQLVHLSTMRKHFDMSEEIDSGSRADLVEMIGTHKGRYTAKEADILGAGMDMFNLFDEQQGGKDLKMASHLTRAKVGFYKGDGRALGWAVTSVKGR